MLIFCGLRPPQTRLAELEATLEKAIKSGELQPLTNACNAAESFRYSSGSVEQAKSGPSLDILH